MEEHNEYYKIRNLHLQFVLEKIKGKVDWPEVDILLRRTTGDRPGKYHPMFWQK
jgi:hypothetical protein